MGQSGMMRPRPPCSEGDGRRRSPAVAGAAQAARGREGHGGQGLTCPAHPLSARPCAGRFIKPSTGSVLFRLAGIVPISPMRVWMPKAPERLNPMCVTPKSVLILPGNGKAWIWDLREMAVALYRSFLFGLKFFL